MMRSKRNGDVQQRVDKGRDGMMRERVRWGGHPAYTV